MNTLTRLLLWIRNHAPLYSWSRCCAEWEVGRQFGQRQIGITRDTHGRFVRIPKTSSLPALVGPSVTTSRSKTGTESSGQGDFLLHA